MIEDTETYTMPNCDVEVVVTYTISGENIYFKYAEIDEHELDCDALGLHIDVTEKWDLIRKTKYISLKTWLQAKLDHDADRILDYHDVHVRSDYEEHFNQGAFI